MSEQINYINQIRNVPEQENNITNDNTGVEKTIEISSSINKDQTKKIDKDEQFNNIFDITDGSNTVNSQQQPTINKTIILPNYTNNEVKKEVNNKWGKSG